MSALNFHRNLESPACRGGSDKSGLLHEGRETSEARPTDKNVMGEGQKSEVEQLRRLKEERDTWWQFNSANNNLFNIVVSLFVFALVIFALSQYFTTLLGIHYLLLEAAAVTILSYGYSVITNNRSEPMFVCPKLECRASIPA